MRSEEQNKQKLHQQIRKIKEQENDQIIYSLIIHNTRKMLDLSLNEYALADTIYHLSNNPKSKMFGWCYASKKTLGNNLSLTKQTIHRLINKLEDKQLIERNPNYPGSLKTTAEWYNATMFYRDRIVKSKDVLPRVT